MLQDLILSPTGGVDMLGSLILHSNNIIALSGGGGGGSSLPIPSLARKVYVSKGGNDGTADGTLAKPFLTIGAAINSITDACAPDNDGNPKQYLVMIGLGTYTETIKTLFRSGIFLVGEVDALSYQLDNTEFVQITTDDSSDITATLVDSRFLTTGAFNISFQQNLNFSTSATPGNNIYLQNVNIPNDLVNDGTIGPVGFILTNCIINNIDNENGGITGTNLVVSNSITILARDLGFNNNFYNSSIAQLTVDTNDSGSQVVLNLFASPIQSISLNNTGGASSYNVSYDAISLPVDRLVTIDPSIQPKLNTSCAQVKYDATTGANWANQTNLNVKQALDSVAPIKNFIDKTSSYSLQSSDVQSSAGITMAGCRVRITSGSANNLTIPDSSVFNAAVGVEIIIEQGGTGQMTIVAGGVTVINSKGGGKKISGQYGVARLYQTDSNIWTLSGDITT